MQVIPSDSAAGTSMPSRNYTSTQQSVFVATDQGAKAAYPSVQQAIPIIRNAAIQIGRFDEVIKAVQQGVDDAQSIVNDRLMSFLVELLGDSSVDAQLRQLRSGLLSVDVNLSGPFYGTYNYINTRFQNLYRILPPLAQLPPRVSSCTQYRGFHTASQFNAKRAQKWVEEMKNEIGKYAATGGKQLRNQVKRALTDIKVGLNTVTTTLTTVIRDFLGAFRRNVNRRGYDTFQSLWTAVFERSAKDFAERRGMSYVPGRQDFWNYYAQQDSNAQEYLIKRGLIRLRTVVGRLRDNTMPAIRAEWVKTFAKLGQVVGSTRSAPAGSGPVTFAYTALRDASNILRRYLSVMSALPIAPPDPALISCQSGSGYAGYGALEDTSPDWSPLLVMGGAVMLGMLGAHLHAKGI
jgi:hypothetical protein